MVAMVMPYLPDVIAMIDANTVYQVRDPHRTCGHKEIIEKCDRVLASDHIKRMMHWSDYYLSIPTRGSLYVDIRDWR